MQNSLKGLDHDNFVVLDQYFPKPLLGAVIIQTLFLINYERGIKLILSKRGGCNKVFGVFCPDSIKT